MIWISFLLAGGAALLTVLSYAELTSANKKAGAEYQFMRKAFPEWPLLSFMAGVLIALNAAATAATVAIAFAGYLNVFVSLPQALVAFALLALCTAVNIIGIRQSTFISIGLICVEVAGLLLLIWAGFTAGDMGASFKKAPAWSDAAGIAGATALIFFIYIGFEDVANLSEEAVEPEKNIPRALLISVVITSVLYLLVAFAAVGLAGPDRLAQSDSPLTTAAVEAQPWMGPALAVAALFATASTALISLVSISRLLFGMAREGDMPRPLSRTWSKRQTPWVAALVLFGMACLLLPLGEVKIVASISSCGVLLVFFAVHWALIVLRFRQPDMKRGFRVPGSVGRVPVLPVLGILVTGALLTRFEPLVYGVVAGAVLCGCVVYMFKRRA